MEQHTKPLLPLDVSSFKKCGGYFGHGIPVGEITATLHFLLGVSAPLW